MQNKKLAVWFVVGVVTGLAAVGTPYLARADARDKDAERLQKLEDRQAIEELFTSYGTTLDRHDFAAFGKLFTEDAVFVGGPGEPARGRPAIQAMLEKAITSNPSNLPKPDFHLFFNPSIDVKGDHATATSKGAYVIPDVKNGGAQIIFFVSYADSFARKGGQWMFERREIHGLIPAPRASSSAS
jgi:ketosteroid isomerase-like protein